MIKTLGGRKLGRTGEHRRALLRNLATSLILHERVVTSAAKAKELRPFAERMITRAKRNQHREVRRDLKNRDAYKKLFDVLAPRYQNRPGGYTQILRVSPRAGDNTPQGLVRLIP
jgi:ribosomal protein L17